MTISRFLERHRRARRTDCRWYPRKSASTSDLNLTTATGTCALCDYSANDIAIVDDILTLLR